MPKTFEQLHTFSPDNSISKLSTNTWNYLSTRYEQTKPLSLPILKTGIPKKIHQIWLGSPVPEKYKPLIKSIQDKNPNFEYKLWTETEILAENFPSKKAFNNSKSYGVKSDIARYEILYRYGGFYFDTDFEGIKNLSDLAERATFIACIQTSSEPEFGNAMLAGVPSHSIFNLLCAGIKTVRTTEMMDIINTTGPGYLTQIILTNPNSLITTDILLPSTYFFPVPNYDAHILHTVEKKKYITEYTYGIHYWDQSWFNNDFFSWLERKINRIRKRLVKILFP